MSNVDIDITFDVRTDSKGRDPDSSSSTLKGYHKILWSKELPNGKPFDLVENKKYKCLYHISKIGEFWLTSDSIIHTYFEWTNMKHIISQIPNDEMEQFRNLAHTIGGYIVFPGNMVNGKHTINQARGVRKVISDRFDLTLECIRRYYIGEDSPLADTIKLYSNFFDLFREFKDYCDFFLLQDLVSKDFASVEFFLPFLDFSGSQMPKTVEEYHIYMRSSIGFLINRNNRICSYYKEKIQ